MIVRESFFDNPIAANVSMDDDCFLCSEKLIVPFIIWSGTSKTICLHPECAGHLGAGLSRDFMETHEGKPKADEIWKEQKAKLPRHQV